MISLEPSVTRTTFHLNVRFMSRQNGGRVRPVTLSTGGQRNSNTVRTVSLALSYTTSWFILQSREGSPHENDVTYTPNADQLQSDAGAALTSPFVINPLPLTHTHTSSPRKKMFRNTAFQIHFYDLTLL